MIKKISKSIFSIMARKKRHVVTRAPEDHLISSGWFQSIKQMEAVDGRGPVPWFTYGAINYLKTIIRQNYRVLEYGAGNSTYWWSQQVAEVVSVEHDPDWASTLQNAGFPNVKIYERYLGDLITPEHLSVYASEFVPLDIHARESADPTKNYRAGLLDYPFLSYASVILEYPRGYFDVIVIDGMARVYTAWLAARQLAENGMIIFDNSDRAEYAKAFEYLRTAGYARIDFTGLGPINAYEWCTSIFVKNTAVLRE